MNRDLLAFDPERLAERFHQPGCDMLDLPRVRAIRENRELVATETCGDVGGPDTRLEAVRERNEKRVTDRVAVPIVDRLEVVEIEEQHRRVEAERERARDVLGEEHPVRELGQRVVRRLVPQLLLERRELCDGCLEPIVLEEHTRMPRVRLEQPNVLGPEPRLVLGVADQHDPHRAAVAVQNGCESTSQAALLHQRTRPLRATPTPEHHNALLGEDGSHEHGLRAGEVGRREPGVPRLRELRNGVVTDVVVGQQNEPDEIRPQQTPGRREQLRRSGFQSRSAFRNAHRRIQLLEMDETESLGRVGPQRNRARGERHHEKKRRGIVTPHQLETCKRDRRAGDRAAEPENETCATRSGCPALRADGDSEEVEPVGDECAATDGERHGEPACRAVRVTDVVERREDEYHGRRRERKPADPTGEPIRSVRLERGSGEKRARNLRDDQANWGCHEEAEDDTRIVDGERRRLGAITDRKRIRLGSEEEQNEAPPRNHLLLVRLAELRQQRHRDDHRSSCDRYGEADTPRRRRAEIEPRNRKLRSDLRHAAVTRDPLPLTPSVSSGSKLRQSSHCLRVAVNAHPPDGRRNGSIEGY